jgi:cytochrome c-type biogenesis protein CcmH/NrfG
VELDGRCGDAQFNLGVSCLQAGRAAEAEPHLAAAVRLQPENVQAKRALADARVMLARQARR